MGSGAARWYRMRRGVTFWPCHPLFLPAGRACFVLLRCWFIRRVVRGIEEGAVRKGALVLVSCSVVTAYGGLRGTGSDGPAVSVADVSLLGRATGWHSGCTSDCLGPPVRPSLLSLCLDWAVIPAFTSCLLYFGRFWFLVSLWEGGGWRWEL